MAVSRRNFLKGGGIAAAGLTLGSKKALAGDPDGRVLRTKGLKTSTTVCPYCAVVLVS